MKQPLQEHIFNSHTRHNNNTNNKMIKITPQCYLMTYC